MHWAFSTPSHPMPASACLSTLLNTGSGQPAQAHGDGTQAKASALPPPVSERKPRSQRACQHQPAWSVFPAVPTPRAGPLESNSQVVFLHVLQSPLPRQREKGSVVKQTWETPQTNLPLRRLQEGWQCYPCT